jgi:uncharacterized membrane protein YkoI
MRLSMQKILAALLLLTQLAPAALGDAPRNWADDNHSHDKARRAVERGEAMTVGKVMDILRSKVPGDIVATEYEHEFDRWVYEFKVIDREGKLRKVHIDAATGGLIEEKHN